MKMYLKDTRGQEQVEIGGDSLSQEILSTTKMRRHVDENRHVEELKETRGTFTEIK
jgi:hypothetical protein